MSDECTQWIKQAMHFIFDEGQTCFILCTSGINNSFGVAQSGDSYMIVAHIAIAKDTLDLIAAEGLTILPLGKMTFLISIVC